MKKKIFDKEGYSAAPKGVAESIGISERIVKNHNIFKCAQRLFFYTVCKTAQRKISDDD